jgi:hypothetical protein
MTRHEVTSDASGEGRLRDRLQRHFDIQPRERTFGPNALPKGARYVVQTLRARVQDKTEPDGGER